MENLRAEEILHSQIVKVLNADNIIDVFDEEIKIETFKDYYQYCQRTFTKKNTSVDLAHCSLGVITELSEIISEIKASLAYERDLENFDKVESNLILELGDLCFFLTMGIPYFASNFTKYDTEKFIADIKFNYEQGNLLEKQNIDFEGFNEFVETQKGFYTVDVDSRQIKLILCSRFLTDFLKHEEKIARLDLPIQILSFLNLCGFLKDVTVKDILIANVKKLRARYPLDKGYTNESANNRSEETYQKEDDAALK